MFGAGMSAAREKRVSPEIKLSIQLTEGSDGYIVAECPDVPGCVSQGKTTEEAVSNLEDVVRTCLALIVKEWIKAAKRGSTPTSSEPVHEEAMILTFVREDQVA